MVKKRVDARVRGLIEHGVRKNHRSMFILVGDHGKDQVENIHKILSKTRVKARPSVLWCYKKELGFSTHRQKRMKEIKRNQARGLHDPDVDDPFDLFISSTNIRWTYYKDTDKILGQTFGMCVLQDFEGVTPNLLARTIETVEGGGIVILLLKTVKSLKQLYTMTMDVHSRYRTEAHHEVKPRFNERFILSLGDCQSCLVLDDELNILPISSTVASIPSYEGGADGAGLREGDADASGYYRDPELEELKSSLADTPSIGSLVEQTKTIDQAKAVMTFLDAISERSLKSTVSLTAGRGRGKSAAIGLCLAGAVAYGYSNIFVTAPSPENLKTVFEFVIQGLKACRYTEHLDFEIIQEHMGEAGKVVVRINIFKAHRQTIQYVLPHDHAKLAQAELVAIDEAAAIPLPLVRKLMGPYLVFMSSTINGYEGTGRSLSLKLIQQLRQAQGASAAAAARESGSSLQGPKKGFSRGSGQAERNLHEDRWKASAAAAAAAAGGDSSARIGGSGARTLSEITLDVPIRYAQHDPIEQWLNKLLCMDISSASTRMVGVMPAPRDCELYVVDRDALFSYHPLAEALLQRIWALYSAAHYKNSPNDLQMLSDAPAHRMFVLLGPQKAPSSSSSKSSSPPIPDVLCVLQVAFEGRISQKSVQSEMARGNKASGDMIPWTVCQQFNDNEFAALSGVRVVRIATHPDVQKMGYGSRAIDLLSQYFKGELGSPSAGLSLPGVAGAGTGEAGSSAILDEGQLGAEGGGGGGAGSGLLEEKIEAKSKLPPLLTPISARPVERLHWLGVSYGLTTQLLNFWSKKGFKTVYVRQTASDLTGEHTAMMLQELHQNRDSLAEQMIRQEQMALQFTDPAAGWLSAFVHDYRKRLVSLMSYSFSSLDSAVAITLLDPERKLTAAAAAGSNASAGEDDENDDDDESGKKAGGGGDNFTAAAVAAKKSLLHQDRALYEPAALNAEELMSAHMSFQDLKRLELYSRNIVDHHMILDLLPLVTKLLFTGRLEGMRLSYIQIAIILAIGLQHRDVDSISAELDLPANQVLAFFNKTIRKVATHLRGLVETQAKASLRIDEAAIDKMERKAKNMESLSETLASTQKTDAKEFSHQQQQRELIMSHKDLARHVVHAEEEELENAFTAGLKKTREAPKMVSVPKSAAKEAAEAAALAAAKASKSAKKEKSKDSKKRSMEAHDDSDTETGMEGQDGGAPGSEKKKSKKSKKSKKD